MKRINVLMAVVVLVTMWACGGGASNEASSTTAPPTSMVEEETDPMENKGIGPVTSVTLEAINQELANEGQEVYENMCTACHKIDKKFIGPSPKGIMERRSPEWIMNMILNPDEMVQKDPIAKQLLIEANGAPMANQSLTEDQARSVLEYFRTL